MLLLQRSFFATVSTTIVKIFLAGGPLCFREIARHALRPCLADIMMPRCLCPVFGPVFLKVSRSLRPVFSPVFFLILRSLHLINCTIPFFASLAYTAPPVIKAFIPVKFSVFLFYAALAALFHSPLHLVSPAIKTGHHLPREKFDPWHIAQ